MMTMDHHHEEEVPKRPKGILKNSSGNVPQTTLSPEECSPLLVSINTVDTKDITLQNTLQNAGRRRSSSNVRPGSSSRRQSAASIHSHSPGAEISPRLKWDETNLYLTEQERTAKMKIDEPKTPFAPHYDPAEDEEEMRLAEAEETLIDAQGVVVDELDGPKRTSRGAISEDEIPDLELGEPEELSLAVGGGDSDRIVRKRSLSNDSHRSDKHVVVGEVGAEGEGDHLLTPEEAKEKHRQFERMRKRHYEMRNIKELLAHPEELEEMEEGDEDDEDDEDDNNAGSVNPPPMPRIPERFASGRG